MDNPFGLPPTDPQLAARIIQHQTIMRRGWSDRTPAFLGEYKFLWVETDRGVEMRSIVGRKDSDGYLRWAYIQPSPDEHAARLAYSEWMKVLRQNIRNIHEAQDDAFQGERTRSGHISPEPILTPGSQHTA